MTAYDERNNAAMDEVIKTLGLEDKIAIWFCNEVEANPGMRDEQLEYLKEMALNVNEWYDEE